MPPRMTTRSVGRGDVTPRGERTDARRGRGSGRGIADNACQPKEFDGKGGAIAYTRWVKKMESVIDMSNCAINQRVKNVEDFKTLLRDEYCPHNEIQKLENESWNHIMVGASHAAYTNRFHELAKLVPRLVTPKFKRINRNGLLKKSSEKRKESGETGRQEDARSNNKRARTGKGFVATDSGKKGYKGPHPKCAKCDYHHQETTPCRTCFNCNQLGHVAKDYRAVAKRNNPNQVLAISGNNFNRGNNGNRARGRAFALGENEALQDPNIMTSTFSLNDQYATVLFDSSVDYSFVTTKFMPFINAQPSDLSFSYVIEMANGENKETNKIIRGCTIVLEDVPFSIDLLPFEL
ncbi:putative reverse transcriptase domain-containing protein [Tanacetum coccineum]